MEEQKFDTVMKKLRKDFSENLIDLSKVNRTVKSIPLSSPSLNYVFGRYPSNRIIEFYGPSSGAKTSLACAIAADIQKQPKNNKILFLDFEHTFDKQFAAIHGLEFDDRFIYVDPLYGEDAFEMVESLLSTGEIGLVIVDSVPAINTRSSFDSEIGKASFGGCARLLSDVLKRLAYYTSRFDTSIIFINQVRAKIGGMPGYGPQESLPGGYALPFYCSCRFRVSKIEFIEESGTVIGQRIKVANKKNKVSYPHREAEMVLDFRKGFLYDNEYMEYIASLGLVKQAGAWFSNEDWGMKVSGRDNIRKFLEEKPELYMQVKNTITAMLTQANVLDAANEGLEVDEEDYS